MPNKLIGVIGLQRSGTTWTQHLIKNNVVGASHVGITAHFGRKPGWKSDSSKHSPYFKWGEDIHLVVPYKEIYAWLKSIHPWWIQTERSRVSSQNFKEFLRKPARVPGRYRSPAHADGADDWTHPNPIKYWCKVMRDWTEVKPEGKDTVSLINYRDLLENPEKTIRAAVEPLGLTVKQDFNAIEQTAMGSGQLAQQKFAKTQFYLDRKYMDSYDQEDIDWIESQLDQELVKKLF